MDIKDLLNEYETINVDADKLAKEIKDQKDTPAKMANEHKKNWKEIKGKINLDKEDKNIKKQVEESLSTNIENVADACEVLKEYFSDKFSDRVEKIEIEKNKVLIYPKETSEFNVADIKRVE